MEGFSAGLVDESNLFEWEVVIVGPPETLYEGGFFKAILTFPEDYPNKPPTMKFVTPLFHPNSSFYNIFFVPRDGHLVLHL